MFEYIVKFATVAGALTSAAVFCVPAAAKDQATVLQASSPWYINVADGNCQLSRSFAEGETTVALYLERHFPGEAFNLLVVGNPLGTDRRQRIDLAFGPNAAARHSKRINISYGSLGMGILTAAWLHERRNEEGARFAKSPDPTEEASVEWFEIRPERRPPIRLMIGPMDEPMKELRSCTSELMADLGVDLEQLQNGSFSTPSPKGDLATWLAGFHPSAEDVRRFAGLAFFRLIVGPDGKPESCHFERSARPKEMDAEMCDRLMERARFEPARDSDGKPIRWYYRSAIGIG